MRDLRVVPDGATAVRDGRILAVGSNDDVAALTGDGRLVAILAPRHGDGLGPTRYFPPQP